SLRTDLGQPPIPSESGDDRRTRRGAHDDGAIAIDGFRGRDPQAKRSRKPLDQLGADRVEARRAARYDHGREPGPIGGDRALGEPVVAEPQAIAVLGLREASRGEWQRGRETEDQTDDPGIRHDRPRTRPRRAAMGGRSWSKYTPGSSRPGVSS